MASLANRRNGLGLEHNDAAIGTVSMGATVKAARN